jgi:MFS family permease
VGLVIFRNLHPTIRRLLLIRTLRSVGQGALVVDFALYLHALDWSGLFIGLVFGASGLFGALLSLLVGPGSDRLGRKPFLFCYEVMVLCSSLVALLSAKPALLITAAVLGSFGRGANGAAGPFSPVEQAWMAEEVSPQKRGWVFSLNSGLGFWGMTLGALIATLPWSARLEGALAYRPLFALTGLTAIANLFLIAGAKQSYRGGVKAPASQSAKIRRIENRMLLKLVSINSIRGLAVGLTGPLIAYWFSRRFGIGPAKIAPVMAATFALTGLASLATGRLSERIGIVQSVIWERTAGLALLLLLPLMPTFPPAAAVYMLRSILIRGSAGANQALTLGLVRSERRGLAAGLSKVSMQLPRSIGPAVAGYLFESGQFSFPFYAAAMLQMIYLVLYRRIFLIRDPVQKPQIELEKR